VLRLSAGPGERPEPHDEGSSKRAMRPLLTNGLPVTVVGEGGRRPGADARGARAAQELYRRALDALTAGQHADAAAGFREFLRLHPAHDFADNAQYWLGECYYDLKDYQTAAREFRRVVDRYPDGNKVADALLKLGYAELALGDEPAGRGTLEKLARQFPKADAAGRAQAKLAELGAPAPTARKGKEEP
jgi:tol-pal system protein YbgF